ncbi:MAG: hypothetical protein Q9P01_13835 [Anaerolineae bacterium]|nr:hypothetical protein [Anaerolineae bacterium]
MFNRLKIIPLTIILAFVLVACGANEPEGTPEPTATLFPTFEFVEPTNPPAFEVTATVEAAAAEATPNTQLIDRGRGRYEDLGCAACHGDNGEGADDGATLIGLALNEADFISFMRSGGLLLNTFVLNNDDSDTPTDQLVITMNPTVQANLTSIPLATPLSDEDASAFTDFQSQIITCADYAPERRSQMLQHIEWLVDPSGIPVDIISAFGSNVQGTLLFGMAQYTSIQWRILDRPIDSCLIEIGQQLDLMLAAFDREPLGIYDDISQ